MCGMEVTPRGSATDKGIMIITHAAGALSLQPPVESRQGPGALHQLLELRQFLLRHCPFLPNLTQPFSESNLYLRQRAVPAIEGFF